MVKNIKINKKIIALIYMLVGLLCILFLIKYTQELMRRQPEPIKRKPIEIEIWTIHGDIEKALNQSIKKYKDQYPEIEFKVKVFKNEVYQSAIANAMVTDTLPDIFFSWGYQKLKDYVEAEVVFDITDYMAKRDIVKDMKPGVMDGFTFNDRYYAMPLFGWNVSLFCNRTVFEQNGVSYPKTYEELLNVIEEFKKKDIIPIATGGKEAWLTSLYYMSFVLETGTKGDVYQAAGDIQRFDSAPFIQAAKRFERLVKARPWQENYSEDDSYNAAYLFTQGKTAMLLTGSWVSSAIDADDSLVKGNVDVIPFPVHDKSQAIGGYVDTYVLSKNSVMAQEEEYVNLYLDLMQSISSISCNDLGIGLPVYNNAEIAKDKFPTLYQCIQNDKDKNYHPAYDQIFDATLTNRYYDLLSNLMLGEIKADDFIKELSKE
jgi:ABC-type glycerol-3-phosphate transport system substrate-binding protein